MLYPNDIIDLWMKELEIALNSIKPDDYIWKKLPCLDIDSLKERILKPLKDQGYLYDFLNNKELIIFKPANNVMMNYHTEQLRELGKHLNKNK